MEVKNIKTIIEEDFGIYDLTDRNRHRKYVDARRIFAKILRIHNYTLNEITYLIGYKDHSSVIHLINSFDEFYNIYPNFKRKYNRIMMKIKENDYSVMDIKNKELQNVISEYIKDIPRTIINEIIKLEKQHGRLD